MNKFFRKILKAIKKLRKKKWPTIKATNSNVIFIYIDKD